MWPNLEVLLEKNLQGANVVTRSINDHLGK